MKAKELKIVNGNIITPKGILSGYMITVAAGKIIDITPQLQTLEGEILDARGNYVAPGCIDIHIHGGNGHDFLEASPEAFYAVTEGHARYGMTAIYPTLAAAPVETFCKAIDTCEQIMGDPRNGARIMGLHLEGNYLNPLMKGGQEESYCYPPIPEEYKMLLARTDYIKRWSVAPELPGALAFGRYAAERGVLVSLAHTVAGYEIVKAAFDAGYTHATHFYNAMSGVHKVREFKHEGAIESIYLMDDMTVELVGDGIHVPPAILKLVHKFKGPGKIALVTDAMYAAAWDNVETGFKDPRVIIEDGVGKLADRSALSSSIATSDRLIRTMVQQAQVSLEDAVRMSSETPAHIMGISDRKGSIEKGKDADIIIFDSDIRIKATMVEGNLVYRTLS